MGEGHRCKFGGAGEMGKGLFFVLFICLVH
jgi:hypothetical protein